MNKGAVLTSVILVSGSAIVKQLVTQKGSIPKTVVGGFAYGAFLFLLAEINDDIAKAMAILVTVSALLVNGPTAVSAIQKGL